MGESADAVATSKGTGRACRRRPFLRGGLTQVSDDLMDLLAAIQHSNAFAGPGSDLPVAVVCHMASSEALERFAAITPWDGELPVAQISTFIPGTELVLIHHNVGVGEVVILARRTPAGRAYGRAAGRTVAEAARNAAIELAQAEFALTSHCVTGAIAVSASFSEHRVLWLVSEADAKAFQRRGVSRPDKPLSGWQTRSDREIPGSS